MVPEKDTRSPPDPQEIPYPQQRLRPGNPRYPSPTHVTRPSGHVTSHYHCNRPCEMVETSGYVSNLVSEWQIHLYIIYHITHSGSILAGKRTWTIFHDYLGCNLFKFLSKHVLPHLWYSAYCVESCRPACRIRVDWVCRYMLCCSGLLMWSVEYHGSMQKVHSSTLSKQWWKGIFRKFSQFGQGTIVSSPDVICKLAG